MEHTHDQNGAETRDTLFMLSGVALVIFGSGLILSNPIVRRLMGQAGFSGLNLLQAAVPDVEKYMKLRNM
ncbi:MAG TPA: hypothetical protein VN924_07340 [Bryobacteraceae bacterium]|jgi:hypothetical protein|nr:hypothetical protein [Bryobacteraceae bacterium]